MTQKEILLKLCGDWTASYDCILKMTKWGWLGSHAQRRCNELVKEGKLEVKHEKRFAYYKTM